MSKRHPIPDPMRHLETFYCAARLNEKLRGTSNASFGKLLLCGAARTHIRMAELVLGVGFDYSNPLVDAGENECFFSCLFFVPIQLIALITNMLLSVVVRGAICR